MNYHHKKFKVIHNSENGIVDEEMIFHYVQIGNILTCDYSGANIRKGQLIGLVDENGCINMRYQQINIADERMTGTCFSTPEKWRNGKIRLHEKWQWTSGEQTAGTSILEET
ncbi:n-acetylglutamate synthase [Putridiphycobacter roseus]|nr:n-acetylglutamate synthase [Putridiphycobacter roseus]